METLSKGVQAIYTQRVDEGGRHRANVGVEVIQAYERIQTIVIGPKGICTDHTGTHP
jgi:hypothetical protein